MAVDKKTVSYMAFNFFSSVCIVFANKVLMSRFPFPTFITACHFLITWAGILVCEQLGIFKGKKLRHIDILPMTVAFCGFVVFNNLSLRYNSVGFYQLMKVMTTPVIVVLQYVVYKVSQDNRLTISLIPVVIGVALATVNDFSFNWVGFSWAVAGVLSTSFYQLFVKTKQASLNADSFQVLKYQAPQAAFVVLVITPLFDQIGGDEGLIAALTPKQYAPSGLEESSLGITLSYLFVSCLLAFCVNLSIFLVVGQTSPVTYNVLGHFKLIVILTGGLLFFSGDSNPVRMLGMAITMVGIIWYTHLKQNIGNQWDKKKNETQNNVASKV